MRVWQSVTRHHPCVACGSASRCAASTDGRVATCYRNLAEPGAVLRTDRNGDEFALYFADGGARPDAARYAPDPEPPRADDAGLDAAYRALLGALPLGASHRADLRARGLSDGAVDAGLYRTLEPGPRGALVRAVEAACAGLDLATVPGFYRDGKRLLFGASPGLLAPVLDAAGRVVALKVRRDKVAAGDARYVYVSSAAHDGASPGSPVHVPAFGGDRATVRLTEGELKASAATHLSGVLTLGMPGVSSVGKALDAARALGAAKVLLAFDADKASNRWVAGALERAATLLHDAGVPFAIEHWPAASGKGIDDALGAGRAADVLAYEGERAWRVVLECLRKTGRAPAAATLARAGEVLDAPAPADADPLADLARRAAVDVRAAFAEDVLEALRDLRARDPGAYTVHLEALRAAGVAMAEWKRALRAAQARADADAAAAADRAAQEARAAREAARGARRATGTDAVDHDREREPYWMRPGQILTQGEDGIAAITNFSGVITMDAIETDGVTETHQLEVEIRIGPAGAPRKVQVPGTELGAMGWLAKSVGPEAVVFPPLGNRLHAAAAIQLLSIPVPTRRVYLQTGWQKHAGAWVYVHAGGGIGAGGVVPGIEARLPVEAQRFVFPPPPEGAALVAAVRAALGLFDLAPYAVTTPVFAAAWRAVLGPSPVTLHLSAEQNLGKTLLASLAQQHFGAGMDAEHPPLTWRSTFNAINKVRTVVGDALVLVDDFLVKGTSDDLKMGDKFDTVVRHQHSGAGTSRMSRELTLRNELPSRSLLGSTGEVLPRGHSTRSRLIAAHLGDRIEVDLAPYREAAAAGVYAQAMAGYVRWLAPRLDDVRRELPATVDKVAGELDGGTADRRTVRLLADLGAGLEFFLRFAWEVGALTAAEARAFGARATEVFRAHVVTQAREQIEQDPATRFLQLLGAALGAGAGYVTLEDGKTAPGSPGLWGWRPRASDGTVPPPNATPGSVYDRTAWQPSGPWLGCTDGDQLLWINRQTALGVVRRFAESCGDPLSLTDGEDLARRLHRRELLATTEMKTRNTLTVRKTIAHHTAGGFLCLKTESIGLVTDDGVDDRRPPGQPDSDVDSDN